MASSLILLLRGVEEDLFLEDIVAGEEKQGSNWR